MIQLRTRNARQKLIQVTRPMMVRVALNMHVTEWHYGGLANFFKPYFCFLKNPKIWVHNFRTIFVKWPKNTHRLRPTFVLVPSNINNFRKTETKTKEQHPSRNSVRVGIRVFATDVEQP